MNNEEKDTKQEEPKKLSLLGLKKQVDEQAGKIDKMVGLLEHLVNKDKEIGQTFENKNEPKLEPEKDIAVEEPKGGETQSPLLEEKSEVNSKNKEIFNKYFAEDDGFKCWMNLDGTIFTVKVPDNFSNRTDAHRALYKEDLRSRKVDQNNVSGSIEQWCQLICQNLKYNKKFSFKD